MEERNLFREIRKKKNAITADAAESLLEKSRRGVLAVNGDDGYPYAIPVNYFYDRNEQKIYFHGARAGHKVDALRASDKVCFTVYGNETIREEAWAPDMQSTVVFGRCRLLETGEETLALLKRFAMKYYPDEKLADEEIAQAGRAAQVFEIEIEHLSGKEVQERYSQIYGSEKMKVEQYVMAYGVEQDRVRAILPDGFTSLRPVLRINAEIRDDRVGYVEFNVPVERDGNRGWLVTFHG